MEPDLGVLGEEALRRSLDLFWPYSEACAQDGVIEIRLWQRPQLEGLDQLDRSKKNEIPLRGFFDDPDKAVKEIKKFDADPATVGIFAVLNQIDPDSIKNRKIKIDNKIGKGQSTKDTDISRRVWLPLDFDPERSAGIMATDQEKQAAKKAQAYINEILIKQHGWPDPVVVDSGNGYHDLFRIDLPNDDNSKQLIRDFFKALNKLLPDDLRGLAKVDEVPHNASRVIKVPGTVVRKKASEGRRWRRSKIIDEPADILDNTVTEGQIQQIIDLADQHVKQAKKTRSKAKSEASIYRPTAKKEPVHKGTKSISDLINDPKIRNCIRQKIFDAAISGGAVRWNHSACLAIATELLASGFDDDTIHQVFGAVLDDGYDQAITQQQLQHTKAKYLADGGSFWTCEELRSSGVIDEGTCVACPARKAEYEMPEIDPEESLDQDLLEFVINLDEARENGNSFGVGADGITRKRQEVKVNDEEGNTKKKVFFNRIADGFAFIESQTRRDNGDAIFTIKGRGSKDGHEFSFDIDARDFSESRKLRAKLVAQFGAANVIKKDFNGEAIQGLTKHVRNFRLIEACRWVDGKAAVPGLDLIDDLKFMINKQVPASFEDRRDLDEGLKSLKALMQSWDPGDMAILAATILGAPIAAQQWSDDRYALALIGLTGTGKTEASKLMLACYGRRYLVEGSLMKWNDGATANALQQIAAQSGFLPILIDNFKPIKGGSAAQLVSVLHAVLEGSEKSRLDRNAQLRNSLEFSCLPIITGESYIEESSTLARSILVEWQPPVNTKKLTEAQDHSDHLLEIGRSWLTWLSSAEGRQVVEEIRSGYQALRSEIVGLLNELGCINAGRIGSSVALIKSLWQILIRHPILGEIFRPYSSAISEALLEQLQDQAAATVEANEAERFVSALRELVTSGRCIIVKGASGLESNARYNESLYQHPERILGWQDERDGRYWLYPDATKKAVVLHQGRQIQEIDSRSLYRQLKDRGYIDTDEKQTCIRSRDPRDRSKFSRFLVFKAETGLDFLQLSDDEATEPSQVGEQAQKAEGQQISGERLAAVVRIA